uniref:Uncharacterized protein n=1 Tax=Neogobius melanostomus TaxID=47308 RepID=A0A8C6WJB2_9GOBI
DGFAGVESDQVKQFKEFLGTYNKVTENCFMGLRQRLHHTRRPSGGGKTCTTGTSQLLEFVSAKYLEDDQRISMRFQEVTTSSRTRRWRRRRGFWGR